ncbi:hypothetical protein SAICODRAFT_19676 [Saitoella complicata NRRL Y-17804]|nr:uncharacterized protein SAICODRAFT_19676 [Saitoella complicata NRRL Y-17804]ODQ52488.1 hypothetical protein SAICODRAFT_19676 [Saitoella complicata NRRL Y-17804]
MSPPPGLEGFLSPGDEVDVVNETRKRAREQCAPLVKAFAECCAGRTISMLWACSDQKKAMMDCVQIHSTHERLDKVRDEFIREKEDKAAAVKKLQQ